MVLLINLESAQLRRAAMTKRLADRRLRHARVAVDMRHLSRDQVTARCASAFPTLAFDLGVLSCAEVGCRASHLTAWRRFVEQSAKRSCTVLEDDVVLRPAFAAAIATLAQHSPPFDVVSLGTSSRNLSSRRRTLVGSCAVHEPAGTVCNTWGYVISRTWIERFFEQPSVAIRLPIDHFLGGRAHVQKPRVGVLHPAVVAEDTALARASQIQPHTFRLDRTRLLEYARRRLLGSRVGDLYYGIYRWL
jgi:GR25 family glycosyltransferase involved in LPS biosynthesis